jgi:hypothetical protein
MNGGENQSFETYRLLFENWRFQVQNNWQRSSYFAVFETAALAGAWSVVTQDHQLGSSGLAFAFLGAVLTLIWTFSNHRSGLYTSYWWKSLCKLEREAKGVGAGLNLVCEYDINRECFGITKVRVIPCLRYPMSMQFVPTLFMFAWLWLIGKASLKLWCHYNWARWGWWVGFALTLVVLLGIQFFLLRKDWERP